MEAKEVGLEAGLVAAIEAAMLGAATMMSVWYGDRSRKSKINCTFWSRKERKRKHKNRQKTNQRQSTISPEQELPH